MPNFENEKENNTDSLYNGKNTRHWFKVKRYYAMNFDFFDMEPHIHREFEIMYVASGNCNIFYWRNESSREEWKVREGEYVFIDCNTRHQLEISRGTHCRILNLEIALLPHAKELCLQELCKQSVSLRDFLRLKIPIFKGYDAAGNLHTIITELHKQLQNPTDEGEHKVMQNLLLAQFIIEVGRQSTQKYYGESGDKYVRKALTYLNNHFDEDIKIKDISGNIGISAAYLQRLFKEQTDMTLIDKVNELRIKKAKILLETSRLPITDVAISVGFNNRQHFTYTFLKITGCSPAIYRKHKGNHLVWKALEEESHP